MTPQEIFDTVVNHLRKQGHKSYLSEAQIETLKITKGASSVCAYRSPDGDKCAAGALITDEEYDVKMEGVGIAPLLKNNTFEFVPASLRDRLGEHHLLIEELQFIHDRVDVNVWEDRLAFAAKMLNLVYTPPNAPDSQATPDHGT